MPLPAASLLYAVTPDGRYIVVRGRLWRSARADLPEEERIRLVSDLMRARRQVAAALRAQDAQAQSLARQAVDAAKRGLGERGARVVERRGTRLQPVHGAQYALCPVVCSARSDQVGPEMTSK